MPDPWERPDGHVHEKYERLIQAAQSQGTIKVAIAHPCDDVSLQGAVEAARLRADRTGAGGAARPHPRRCRCCQFRYRQNGARRIGTQP